MSPDRLPKVRLDVVSTEQMQINAFLQATRTFLNLLSPSDCSPGHDPEHFNTAQLRMPTEEQGLKLESVAPPYLTSKH